MHSQVLSSCRVSSKLNCFYSISYFSLAIRPPIQDSCNFDGSSLANGLDSSRRSSRIHVAGGGIESGRPTFDGHSCSHEWGRDSQVLPERPIQRVDVYTLAIYLASC